jgi:hypothetical protein
VRTNYKELLPESKVRTVISMVHWYLPNKNKNKTKQKQNQAKRTEKKKTNTQPG